MREPTWTAGALAGMRAIEQALALIGSSGAVPARAPAVHIISAS